MANLYFDWNPNCKLPITPYLGFGMGRGSSKIRFEDKLDSNSRIDLKNEKFVYQIIVGASYSLSKKVELGLEYRYLGVDRKEGQNSICLNIRKFF